MVGGCSVRSALFALRGLASDSQLRMFDAIQQWGKFFKDQAATPFCLLFISQVLRVSFTTLGVVSRVPVPVDPQRNAWEIGWHCVTTSLGSRKARSFSLYQKAAPSPERDGSGRAARLRCVAFGTHRPKSMKLS